MLLVMPLLLLLAAVTANALPSLTASAPTNTAVAANATTTLTGVSLAGGGSEQTLRVSVATDVGTLSLPNNPTGLTLAEGFSSWQNQSEIAFTGALADVNAALADLSISPGDTGGDEANVSINAQEFNSAMVYSPTNGHYYEYVPATGITFDDAKPAAAGRSYGGHSGYIASIPTATINTLIAEKIPNADNVWFGGDATNAADGEAPVQRDWHWAAGPLAGQSFLQCSNWTFACEEINGPWPLHAIWSDGEPNNDPWETAAVTNWLGVQGRWNDLETTNSSMVTGYIVEYGDLADGVSFPFGGTASAEATIPVADVSNPPTSPQVSLPTNSNIATVSWTAPTNGSGIPVVTGYSVSSSPAGATCTAAADETSCEVSSLTWGTAYSFSVTAQNSVGSSDPSASTDSVTPYGPPSAPTNVVADATHLSALITWDVPSSDGGTSLDDYLVEVSTGGSVCAVGYQTTDCTVSGLAPGVEVRFRVKAYNSNMAPATKGGEWSEWSEPITPVTVPNEPENVLATTHHNTATVSWDAPSETGGLPIIEYTVTASPGGASCTAVAPLTACSIENLEYGTEYTFAVSASNTAGSGDAAVSNPVTPEMLPPGPPTNVLASLLSKSSASISWTPPAETGGGDVTYEVSSEPGGLTCATIAPSCVIEGLAPGVTYVFTVRARNAAGSNDASVARSPGLEMLNPLVTTVAFGRTKVLPRNARGKVLTRMFKPRRGKDSRARDGIKVRGGTKVTVTSNRATRMTVTLRRQVRGVKTSKRWARTSMKMPQLKIKSGTSFWRFSARAGKQPLMPGKYQMSFRAVDADGNVAHPQAIEFTVLSRGHH